MRAIPKEIWERFKILNLNITNQQGTSLNPTPIRPSLAAGTATGPLLGSDDYTAFANILGVPQVKKDEDNRLYYLTWPNQMPGDTIPTVNVNLVYTPVAPALPWKKNTFYPAGSIVISDVTSGGTSTTDGHYYVALTSGISGPDTPPDFDSARTDLLVTPVNGSGLEWRDMGPISVSPVPPIWKANTAYADGALVTPDPSNGRYYKAHASPVQSGAFEPGWPTASGATTWDSCLSWKEIGAPPRGATRWAPSTVYAAGAQVVPMTANQHYYQAQEGTVSAPAWPVNNGTVVAASPCLSWKDKGPINSVTPVPPLWKANTAYANGALVTPDPANGHYYQTQHAGASGLNAPAFPVDGTTVKESDGVRFLDVGPTAPANAKLKTWVKETPYFVGDVIQDVSTGHYYSVTQAGISGDTPPKFTVNAPKPGVQDGTTILFWQDLGTVLPASVTVGTPPGDQTVNLLTYTFPQAHALSRFNLAAGVLVSSIKTRSFVNQGLTNSWATITSGATIDPVLAVTAYIKPMDAERPWRIEDLIPGLTLGISLASPSTNFYFGGSSELFVRNLQLVYGFSLNRVSALDPASLQLSATTAATHQVLAKGVFVGLSFNITGFIQTLF
jgi:hypothetical protein